MHILLFRSLWLVSFLAVFCSAQEILVLDNQKNAISQVLLQNTELLEQVESNEKGKILIPDHWQNQHTVEVSHLIYTSLRSTVGDLRREKIIYLSERSNLLQEIQLMDKNINPVLSTQAARTTIISAREIARINPTTSAELLAQKAGINIQKSQSGGGSINIRGSEANRILLIVDGVRLNNAIFRGGHIHNSISIDPSILENTEVSFGPGSVEYGSDALGGVVHFRTREPILVPKPILQWRNSYYSASDSRIHAANLEYSKKNIAFLTSASHSNFGDIRMGKQRFHGYSDWGKHTLYNSNGEIISNPDPDVQLGTAYQQFDLLHKTKWFIDSGNSISSNIQYSESTDIQRYDQLNDKANGTLKFLKWNYGPQIRFLNSLTYQRTISSALYDVLEITAAQQQMKESRMTQKNGSDVENRTFETVDVYSLNIRAHKSSWFYGAEAYYNTVDSRAEDFFPALDSTRVSPLSRYPSQRANMLTSGAYIRRNIPWNHWLSSEFGVRASYTDVSGKYAFGKGNIQLPSQQFRNINTDLNFHGSLTYKVQDKWKTSVLVSTGFHAPNIDDISKFFEKSNNSVVPNFDLQSEYFTNFEWNISRRIANKHIVNIDLYYTHLTNPIVKVDEYQIPPGFIFPTGTAGNLQSNINEGRGFIAGGSIYTSSQWNNRWKTSFDLTYTEGGITRRAEGYTNEGGEILAHIPPLFGRVSAQYMLSDKWTHQLLFTFNAAKDIATYDVAGVDNLDESPRNMQGEYVGTPGWWTLDYSTNIALSPMIDLQIGVTNLFDAHYKRASSGISEMGRSFNCTLRAKI